VPGPADVSVTTIWPSTVNRSPSKRPDRQMRSSQGSEWRGDDESDARPRESEDSKTDKNAFGHGQLLWDIPRSIGKF
jgi:hypothetical protein